MNTEEIYEVLKSPEAVGINAFSILKEISNKIPQDSEIPSAQDILIRLLEHREVVNKYAPLLNSLLREVGLYPYIQKEHLIEKDLVAFETHRPLGSVRSEETVFHRVQAQVYWGLLDDRNIVLSAPTSFGKSLITDALIASGKYKRLVIIVPTIALIDETRKRLSKFREQFRIVTHSSQSVEDQQGTIYVLTQERAIERLDLNNIDLLIIDEFYKLDPKNAPGERSAILNHAFYKLLKTSKQFYLLGPNIRNIPQTFIEKFNAELILTDYVTVATNIVRVDTTNGNESALVALTNELKDPSIIYCQSPPSVRRVAQILIDAQVTKNHPSLNELVDWTATNFHEEWIVTQALAKGIGIHHGRIPRSLAQYQVQLFNQGKLKFLICTSTLIEGVNTIAKNVVIYDNKVANSKFDYFTFKNIQGRSGRMLKHFIGSVYLFHEPPPEKQLELDFPVITLSDTASDALLLQMEEADLNQRGLDLLKRYSEQRLLSIETIKANAHVDPEVQLALAQYLYDNALELVDALSWAAIPTSPQLYTMCQIIFDAKLVPTHSDVIRSAEQLGYFTNLLRTTNDLSLFIKRVALGESEGDINDKIDRALDFLRNWASHHLPKAILVFERIQNEVFGRLGLTLGKYSTFALHLENLMLPPALNALDEYGVPAQIAKKIKHLLPNDNLDVVLEELKNLNMARTSLTQFEKKWVDSIKPYL